MSHHIDANRATLPPPDQQSPPVLQVEGLRTEFYTREGVAVAVDDISFVVN
ncbi:hypothetical protein GF339_09370, partial [candidate division KSB3 bacterium]|nr:hypothetical protein [candidate division KSB3 bacterium]MBD3324781.1 hypothetical protein [candidate division KSB3 bacterium]